MKTIRLAVFCEDYWSKGLIYTQNILPLKKISEENNCKFEIISFTSFLYYLLNRKAVSSFCKEMREQDIDVKNYFTAYYPTRFLTARWFVLPFLYFNTLPYILWLRFKDRNKDIIYNLRSYEISMSFFLQYGNYEKLIFDPRTDWIDENVNQGFFCSDGINVKIWNCVEKKIIQNFRKTIFISDVFKQRTIEKHMLKDCEKLVVLYNPIDYKLFENNKQPHDGVAFLYTGSLGHWNRLETYLDFFSIYHQHNNNSNLVICTSTSESKIQACIADSKYHSIKDFITVYYNVPFDKLPDIYKMCDYGLQLMNKLDSRVGVKYIEYLAAGITPIVHANVMGAAYLSEKYKLGIVINDNDSDSEILKKIKDTPRIDKESSGYRRLKELSDLNSIDVILKSIYLL